MRFLLNIFLSLCLASSSFAQIPVGARPLATELTQIQRLYWQAADGMMLPETVRAVLQEKVRVEQKMISHDLTALQFFWRDYSIQVILGSSAKIDSIKDQSNRPAQSNLLRFPSNLESFQPKEEEVFPFFTRMVTPVLAQKLGLRQQDILSMDLRVQKQQSWGEWVYQQTQKIPATIRQTAEKTAAWIGSKVAPNVESPRTFLRSHIEEKLALVRHPDLNHVQLALLLRAMAPQSEQALDTIYEYLSRVTRLKAWNPQIDLQLLRWLIAQNPANRLYQQLQKIYPLTWKTAKHRKWKKSDARILFSMPIWERNEWRKFVLDLARQYPARTVGDWLAAERIIFSQFIQVFSEEEAQKFLEASFVSHAKPTPDLADWRENLKIAQFLFSSQPRKSQASVAIIEQALRHPDIRVSAAAAKIVAAAGRQSRQDRSFFADIPLESQNQLKTALLRQNRKLRRFREWNTLQTAALYDNIIALKFLHWYKPSEVDDLQKRVTAMHRDSRFYNPQLSQIALEVAFWTAEKAPQRHLKMRRDLYFLLQESQDHRVKENLLRTLMTLKIEPELLDPFLRSLTNALKDEEINTRRRAAQVLLRLPVKESWKQKAIAAMKRPLKHNADSNQEEKNTSQHFSARSKHNPAWKNILGALTVLAAVPAASATPQTDYNTLATPLGNGGYFRYNLYPLPSGLEARIGTPSYNFIRTGAQAYAAAIDGRVNIALGNYAAAQKIANFFRYVVITMNPQDGRTVPREWMNADYDMSAPAQWWQAVQEWATYSGNAAHAALLSLEMGDIDVATIILRYCANNYRISSGNRAGAFVKGNRPDGSLDQSISVESNMALYTALRRMSFHATNATDRANFASYADAIKNWLFKPTAAGGAFINDGQGGYFITGYHSDGSANTGLAADIPAIAILLFYPTGDINAVTANHLLDLAKTKLSISALHNGQTMSGFRPHEYSTSVLYSEFTLQLIQAASLLGRQDIVNYLTSIQAATINQGSGIPQCLCGDIWCDTTIGWYCTPAPELASAVQYTLHQMGINLFAIPEFTPAPTRAPTPAPTRTPTPTPTRAPTEYPTFEPTKTPTLQPSAAPTNNPTTSPTLVPTMVPTPISTSHPTLSPTLIPTNNPTISPTLVPTVVPTPIPTSHPTLSPTPAPTPEELTTKFPTLTPTPAPTAATPAPTIIVFSPGPTPSPNATLPSPTVAQTPAPSPQVTPEVTPGGQPNTNTINWNLWGPLAAIGVLFVTIIGIYGVKKYKKKPETSLGSLAEIEIVTSTDLPNSFEANSPRRNNLIHQSA